MRTHSTTLVLTALMVSAFLAGCAGSEDLPDGSASGIDSEPVADPGLLSESSQVSAPSWKVGDWFGHHVFFGAEDSEGFHFEVVLVSDQGSSYVMATEDQQMAKEHAVIDIPFLGEIRKSDLAMTGLGGTWDLYEFPLKHNATWTSNVEFGEFMDAPYAGQTLAVTYTATLAQEITTPEGKKPGYEIVGTTENGSVLYEYDYVPALGWYAHFYMYDVFSADPADYVFHSMNMGRGSNWTGTYYIDTAAVALEAFHHVIPPAAPQGVAPAPYHGFTVDAEADYLMGYLFAFALTGAQVVEVVDPEGGHREYQAVNTESPEGGMGSFQDDYIDWPAKAGEWHVAFPGAGVATVAGAFIWTVTETTGTL